jgi:hypothetical protein
MAKSKFKRYTELEIESIQCICGHESTIFEPTKIGMPSSNSASVMCGGCGLIMSEHTNKFGYGETVESLTRKVVDRWNNVMSKSIREVQK